MEEKKTVFVKVSYYMHYLCQNQTNLYSSHQMMTSALKNIHFLPPYLLFCQEMLTHLLVIEALGIKQIRILTFLVVIVVFSQ